MPEIARLVPAVVSASFFRFPRPVTGGAGHGILEQKFNNGRTLPYSPTSSGSGQKVSVWIERSYLDDGANAPAGDGSGDDAGNAPSP